MEAFAFLLAALAGNATVPPTPSNNITPYVSPTSTTISSTPSLSRKRVRDQDSDGQDLEKMVAVVKKYLKETDETSGQKELFIAKQLYVAIEQGNHKLLYLLLSDEDGHSNFKTSGGVTPLHLAVARGQKACVDVLLTIKPHDAQKIINTQNCNGNTALHIACKKYDAAYSRWESATDTNTENDAYKELLKFEGIILTLNKYGADWHITNDRDNEPEHLLSGKAIERIKKTLC